MQYPISVPEVNLYAGKFTNGDPLLSIPRSIDRAEDMNRVYDELIAVVTGAGLTPSEADNTQLFQAINNLINGGDYKASVRYTTTANIVLTGLGTQAGGDWASALTAGDRILAKDQATGADKGVYIAAAGAWSRATDADTGTEFNGGAIIPVEEGTVNANTNWQITNDGTVTIGSTALIFQVLGNSADASETVKGIVEIADNAEAQAFTANKVIDGAKLNTAFKGANQSLAASGYQKLPGGLILQWGVTASLTDDTASSAVTFPVAFPTACVRVFVTGDASPGSGAYAFGVISKSTTGFNVSYSSTPVSVTQTGSYFAIGY